MNSLLDNLIIKIRELQTHPHPSFPGGIFPAYRTNPLIGYRRDDTTVFFSAIIAFTLQSIGKHTLSSSSGHILEQIIQDVIATYPDFQNKDGLKTYNFWKTRPSQHFPNGFLFKWFEHFRIPDDIDDTALIYLTTSPTREEQLWLKDKLAQHANGSRLWIRNTFPEYSSLAAYSTWFGKNMYIEFDACVLSNMLYCIYQYDLPLNHHDESSLAYIRSVIETDRYRKSPFRCAHQYPRTALIIYHVARLIARFNPPTLETIHQKLITDSLLLFEQSKHPLDKVMLASSLMRLGHIPPRIAIEKIKALDFKGFYFFIAGLLTAYENPVLYRLSALPLWHMRWECEAHCWALLAEYESLWQQRRK